MARFRAAVDRRRCSCAAGALGIWSRNDRLTISGPYAHLRHPLYLGTILCATGFAISGIGPGWLTVCLVMPGLALVRLHYFPRKERSRECATRGALRRHVIVALSQLRCPRSGPRLRELAATAGPKRCEESVWALEFRYSDNNELGTLLAVPSGLLVFWLRAALGHGMRRMARSGIAAAGLDRANLWLNERAAC